MKNFNSLGSFGHMLLTLAAGQELAQASAMERSAKLLQKTAQEKLGQYQAEAGPFVAWAELADSTKEDRARKGYPEDEPLLRDGTLRDSIERQSTLNALAVGSNNPIAEFQELGTEKIPPRSFLGSTAVEKGGDVAKLVGKEITLVLSGGSVHTGKIEIS